MCGVDTGRIVAFMANKQAVRDRAIVKFPGEAMSFNRLAVLTHAQSPISPFVLVANPKPAAIGFLDALPKSLLNRASRMRGQPRTSTTAKTPLACCDSEGVDKERRTAVLAGSLDCGVSSGHIYSLQKANSWTPTGDALTEGHARVGRCPGIYSQLWSCRNAKRAATFSARSIARVSEKVKYASHLSS
jgi:hypothetical protein